MKPSEFFRIAIKKILSERRVSQKEFAKKIGESPQVFNDYLAGRRNYSEKKEAKIAELLGITHMEVVLFGLEIEKKSSNVEDNRPDYRTQNSLVAPDTKSAKKAEQSLSRLSILAQIPLKNCSGWADCLALWLGVEYDALIGWIENDEIPQPVIKLIADRGYAPSGWLLSEPNQEGRLSETEQRFRALAKLAGVKIGVQWADRLAAKIGVDSLELTQSLYNDKIPPELIQRIEAAGYPAMTWAANQYDQKSRHEEIVELRQRLQALEAKVAKLTDK